MPHEASEKVKHLESRYTEICKHLQKAASVDSEFLKIIHNPGYTTPAEIEMAVGLLDTMQQQVKAIGTLNETLINGARAGVKGAAAA